MKTTVVSRRHFLAGAGSGLALIAGSGLILPTVANAALNVNLLQPGDVLLGRAGATDSPAWGYWRHVALWDGSRIIEGGTGMTCTNVSATDLRQFEARYRIIMVQRLKWASTYYAPKMAAATYVVSAGERTAAS